MPKTATLLVVKKLIISLFILFNLCVDLEEAQGQVFDSEQNPPGVKWRQIRTENFQIIYPSGLAEEANRMANTLEHIIPRVSASLGKKPRKISVILQNQGTTSNGFVQLAPRRSEYFTTPSQEFDYQDWLNSLAVHELRHVVQFDKLTGNLKAPFFEELALAIFGVTLPPWFYEGDAVGTETALTSAGRGRLPSWELNFRTSTLSGLHYTYSKNFLGSARDLTPGYYQLGYFMSSKLRRDYGESILDSLMTRVSKNPFRPYGFSNSVKKYTGLTTRQLHDSTVAELSRLWRKQFGEVKPKTYTSINKRTNNTPTDYLLPVAISPNSTLAIRQGKARAPAIITVDQSGNEKLVIKIGFQEEPNFSYSSEKIVWDEFRFDKRFQKRSYNVINIYDMTTQSHKQLTHRSRLFAPVLSPDGKTIAAVKVSLQNSINIIELDAESGKEIKVYPNPQNFMLQTPAFNKAGNKLVYTGVSQEGATMFEVDRQTAEAIQVMPFQAQQISRPSYADKQILFRAHYNGLDNIYRFDPETKKTFQLTSAEYGAFNPKYDETTRQVYFNNFTAAGNDISRFPFGNQNETEISFLRNTFIDFARPLIKQEGDATIFDSIPERTYASGSYREINNLFYFHSLSPIAKNVNLDDDPTLGLRMLSNNKLNTLDLYAGYQYNSNLKKSEYLAGFTYKRFYPIIDVRYINQAKLSFARRDVAGIPVFTPISWRENFTEIEVSVPFIFNRLNQTYNLGFRSSTSYTSRYDIQNRPNNFITKLNFPLRYLVFLNRNNSRSARDLAPAWGQNITISYQHLPFDKVLSGDLFTVKSLFYTPGLLRHHSFQTSFNYQINSGAYNLTNDIPLISGFYNLTPLKEISNTLLFDYRFPLFYPDWELGPIAYVKRFRGGLFADFENVFNDQAFTPRTYGAEIRADMNLLRFYLPNFEISGKIIFVNQKPSQNPIFETGFSYSF